MEALSGMDRFLGSVIVVPTDQRLPASRDLCPEGGWDFIFIGFVSCMMGEVFLDHRLDAIEIT
jgi:hypothetical protein